MIETSYCLGELYSISEDLYERKIKRLKRKHASFTQSTVLFQFPCFQTPAQVEDDDNSSPVTPNSHSDQSEQGIYC